MTPTPDYIVLRRDGAPAGPRVVIDPADPRATVPLEKLADELGRPHGSLVNADAGADLYLLTLTAAFGRVHNCIVNADTATDAARIDDIAVGAFGPDVFDDGMPPVFTQSVPLAALAVK